MSVDVLKQLLRDIGIAETVVAGIAPHTRLRADLGLSSTETTDLEIQLRDQFDARISLWDKEDYTVAQLVASIRETAR
ncbi:acyl carrier protein [Amycolatopsis sp. NPDC054798]